MESVRNLEDETFPSFLLQSERGNSSEMLENVTVSSNFGLPMAASTVAKDKSDSGKRPPDVQSSYLEEGRFSTVDAHPSNVSNSETCQKFALSFKDELEHVDDFLDAHCIPDVMEKLLDEFGSLPSKGNLQHALPGQYNNGQDSKLETFSVGKLDERSPLDCLTDNEKTNKVDGTKDPGTTPATKQMDDDLGIRRYSDSLASLLEDERLLSLASLEDQSSDDDEFAAEAFGDERLEAYFKQLVPPGTQRGHTEGQELPEVHAAFQVTSNNPTRWHQGNFQMPPVRQEATGMDSAPSSGPDTEDELEAAQQSALQVHLSRSTRQLLGESNHPSFRPGLEGGSSDESIGPLDELNDIGFEFRRGAEGQVINSPVGGGGGDGSSGNEEDGNIGASASLSNSTTYGDRWGCKMVDRNVAGEEGSHDGTVTVLSNTATVENLQGLRMMDRNVAGQDESHTVLPSQGDREFADQNETEGRLDPVGNGKVITAVPGIPLNLPSRRSSTHHQETLEAVNTTVRNEMKLDSVYFRAVSGNVTTDDQLLSTVEGTPFRLSHIACTPSGNGITDLRDGPCGDIMGHTAARGSGDADESFSADLGPPLAAAYLSPVYPVGSASEMWRDSSKSSPFHKQQKADWSTGCSQWDNEKGQRQSVVYQNEEGNWVTDLAYYYSLDKEQDHFSLPTDLVDSIQEETFITGNKAIALIEEDQEEFEEENKFIKDDKMDATLMDGSLGNDSWQLPANSYLMLRASQAGSDFMQGSQSYLRLTLGEFFSERSEALGCLGEQNSGIKRPSFGYSITSPERRAPVVLFEADVSKDHSETSELCNDNALHSAELRCTDQETIAEITTMFPTDEQTGNDKFQIDKEPTSGIHMNESGNMQYMSSPVKVEEPRACNGTDSVLSISTIASAIADASVSADPSQLAAMILELSNKNRKKSELAAISTKPNAELQDQKSNMKDLGVMVEKICERSETNESQVLKSEFKQTSESVSTCSSDSVGSSENSRNPPSMSNSFSEKSSLSSTSKEESKKAMLLNEELCQNNPKNDSSYCTSKNTCQSVKDRNRPHGQNDSTETCTPESSRFQGHKGGYSQFTNAKWMTKEGFVNNRAFSSGNAMTEVPNINCTVSVVEKHEESPSAISEKLSVQKREVGAYLDKSLHKAKAESVSEMKQKDVKKMFSEMSYERVLRIEHQDLKMPVSPELTAVHGVTVSNSSLHHPKLQTIEPVEQTFTESVSEDNKEMEVISKLQGERDEQESSNFNNQEVCVNFQQYHQAPVAPKNSTADHTCAADQLNLRPLTHSSPGQVSDFPTPTSSSSSLTHSSANLTRLSYISGIDATLQNSTAIGSPVNSENDKTIELSTTIIRSSPTPTPDQTIVNSSDLTFSSSLEGPKSCEQDLQERKLDYDKQPSDQTKSPESQDGKARGSQTTDNLTSPQSEKAKIQPSKQQLDVFLSASNKPMASENPSTLQKADHVCLSWQDKINRIHCADSLNAPSVTSSGLSVLPPLTTDYRYSPISSFKPPATSSEVPMAGSALLTGHSLAQQYLGALTSTANCLNVPLTSCYLGNTLSSNMHSLAAGLPGARVLMENIRAFGTPLDPKLGTRMLNSAQFYSAHTVPLDSNFITQPVSYQPSRIGMFDQWSGGLHLKDIGQVLIPEELKFPNSCCVGIASQTSLSMFNPTERWMQVSIGIVSVLVNGEKMDAFAHQCWIFKNKTIIGPHVTEDLKLMFLPRHSGIFQCIICVSSYPVSSDVNTIVRAEALARRVVITAVAEDPLIEVLAGKNRSLDFGDLVPGSDKVLSLKLINRTHATVPIRLVISANAAAWRCFTFCKPDALAETALRTESTSPLVAPSVMNHVMPASYEGEDPESFILWVHFHAPQKYIRNADPLGAAEDYFARVDIEVDTPGPCTVINSLPLCARVGIARIHAPKDLQMLVMCAQPGMMAKQILPLKNAGNIDAQLQIQTAESCFLAKPENLLIRPGEELEVVVSFIPPLDTQNVIQSHLTILVQPFGPQYQVALKGLLGKPESVQSITSSSNSSIGVPPILSNKQFMSWGGVSLGRAVQQKLILRNNSSSVVQQLRLLIKGQDQDCFQLQSTFGPEERRSGSRELMICPKEDVCVHLLFAPTRVACMLARLEIKQSGMHSGQPGVKFTIPLSGYGGTSNIILEDVDKQSDGYVMNLNGITPDRVTQLTFRMRNTGSRAAYVQAACFSDFHMTTFMTTNAVHVSPAQFVLKERTQETITVTCHSNLREYLDCKTDPTLLCRVCFFWGDEVARQQLRRALSRNRHAHEHLVCNDSPLRKMNFNQTFPGEELIFEKVYDIPKRTNDIKIFYANLKKVTLSVTGSSTTEITSEALDSFSSSHSMSVESESVLGSAERNPSNTSLDVLPVRGPHGSPLSLNASNQMLKESPKQKLSWSIRPEYLILTVPSADGSAQTGRVQIINHSPRSLPFEMSWPAHSLTVTPQHGVVDPESHLLILVSPNPSLIAKPSAVPWSGKIYVQCDNIQQLIKVQIREDVIMDTSASVLSPSAVLDTELWTPNLNLAKPLLKSPPTKLKIKNRTVHFPLTTAGSTSESLLEIENGGEDTVQWFLSSFAPPYVKWVDESGDIYRATYTVFRCSRLSGTLQGLSKEKLPIMFMPRDKGDYSQFWDLECRLAAQPHRKHKIQFQLHGAGTKAEGSSKETDSATKLIKTETAMKTRKSVSGRLARTGQEQPPFKGVFAPEDLYSFPATPVGESSTLKINLRNSSSVAHMLKFVNPREPFYIKHSNYSLRAQHYINLPVRFKPESDGRFEALLVIQTDTCGSLPIRLIGDAIRKE
ncbi:centrosomal protein of 192 kDa isoform X1 [Chiloscyllium plagiosum]|uniref:centrosomal protein of 192 kDa isoform X1 n=1 Tax=Chiloscyllium plagiosum TaxID=36176 RepID=UPI001CB82A55|nr:centrosomal protein of 192 kDa isoform X1 [Chiloscyllium plagiosum]